MRGWLGGVSERGVVGSLAVSFGVWVIVYNFKIKFAMTIFFSLLLVISLENKGVMADIHTQTNPYQWIVHT